MNSRRKIKRTPSVTSLPTENEFNPWNCDLDAQHAWKQFGGLDLEQAYEKFCENPMFYQEDFLFMGPVAFKFYFPVVDRFLRREREAWEFDDSQAWILGGAMRLQLERRLDDDLLEPVGSLCCYVQSHLQKFASAKDEQEAISASWREVEQLLAAARGKTVPAR